jgi:RNA polymerase sigma-70 factor (ECF subfamily)
VPSQGNEFEEASGSLEPEDLFRRYYRAVVAFFISKGFSNEESRDLAQETFLRVYRYRERFRGESGPATWIFQVASNLYKNTIRSLSALKREGPEVSLSAPDDEDAAHSVEDRSDPLGEILTEERARLLREALSELPPQMRRCVQLRTESNLKYREIAVLMSLSIETVKAHLYQARQHLRDKLADYSTNAEL